MAFLDGVILDIMYSLEARQCRQTFQNLKDKVNEFLEMCRKKSVSLFLLVARLFCYPTLVDTDVLLTLHIQLNSISFVAQ